jgi:two-component system, cell cycle response regulator
MSLKDTHPDLLLAPSQTELDGPAQPPPVAYLVHIYPPGPALGVRHPLRGDPVLLGRDAAADVCVADLSVSRRHARFDMDDHGYWVTDLGSTNGTCVNKVPVSRCKLRDGDELRIGNCVYRFLDSNNVEAQYHAEVHRLSNTDTLTEVANRRQLEQVLAREMLRSKRYHRPLALVLIDADHFKAVNDRLGHVTGDQTLRALAARIQAAVRQEGLVARYGGEEFAVVLPEASLEAGVHVAERIRAQVAQAPFCFNDAIYSVTVSIGVAATSGEESLGLEEFLDRADTNLYRAKREGRNRVSAAPADLDAEATEPRISPTLGPISNPSLVPNSL